MKTLQRSLVRFSSVLVAFSIIFLLAASSPAQVCTPSVTEITWLEDTIEAWDQVREADLKQPNSKLPWMVLFDDTCVLNIDPERGNFDSSKMLAIDHFSKKQVEIFSSKHHGSIELPNGSKLPPNLVSFAADLDDSKGVFLVAALPSIWAKAAHLKNEPDVNALARTVYIHELTHAFHRNFFDRLSQIEKELTDVENFDDDIIQNRFGIIRSFRDAYVAEIELTRSAVAEPDKARRKKLVRQIARSIRERRRTHYVGENRRFAEVEDIFLTMEGVANWAAYRSAIRGGMTPANASTLVRRSGKWWSQEEGIFLFMLIDSLLPNWHDKAFRNNPMQVVDLLSQAAK
jgi:hypothetical protein